MMTFSLIWLLPLLVMVPCYLTIIVLVHLRSQQFDNCASGNIGEAKMKTVKMTGILILGFLLCVTPYGLIEILSVWYVVGPETSGGFYEYSSLLCLLVTALSLTTTAGSDKLKEFARVGIFSTAITKFI